MHTQKQQKLPKKELNNYFFPICSAGKKFGIISIPEQKFRITGLVIHISLLNYQLTVTQWFSAVQLKVDINTLSFFFFTLLFKLVYVIAFVRNLALKNREAFIKLLKERK